MIRSWFKNKLFSLLILCKIIFIRQLFIYPMINHSCQVNRSPMRGLLYNNIFFRICFIWDRFDSQKENRISIDAGLIQFAFGSQKSIRTWFWNNSIHKTKIDFRIRCRVGSIHKKKLDSHLIRKINSHLILNSFDLEKETRIIFDWKWFDSFFKKKNRFVFDSELFRFEKKIINSHLYFFIKAQLSVVWRVQQLKKNRFAFDSELIRFGKR